MIIKIDENKYTPELVFDNAGLKVYKYNKPFFVYSRSDRIVDVTATRCIKEDGERLYKTPCAYLMWLSQPLIYKINQIIDEQLSVDERTSSHRYIDSGWDELRISSNYETRITEAIKEITGYDINGIFRGCFFNARVVNCKNERDYYKNTKLFLQRKDWVELTNATAKERRHEEEVNKQILVDTLFGANIDELCKKHKLTSDKGHSTISFSWGANGAVDMIKKYIEEYVAPELESMGLEFEFNPEFERRFRLSYATVIKNIKLKEK